MVFAHGSGSNRHSARNHYVAEILNQAVLATLFYEIVLVFNRRAGQTIAGPTEIPMVPRGLAAEGLAGVCRALRSGDVDTLIVGELGDATVVTGEARTTVAPDPDTLSELGEPMERVARADEALPFAAIAIDASLVRADNRIAPVDGIGALLRYVMASGSTS
ncbi:hypothetical protein MXEN_17904 [Mycobacterium xenopi RIVM700367]|nr:hypothetical protein MXEN_17904 [Mycobacterium xenopi RIVM700367]